ncbi:MAG: SMP-30/gluconolactonase/LRE family protein [Pirellulales bacterium]
MIAFRRVLALLLPLALTSAAAAGILPPGATPQQLVTGYGFTEGPLYDGAGGVYFSDMNRSDIVRYDIAGHSAQIVDPNSGTSNGLIKNPAGNIISADRDRRQISLRSLADLKVVETVLASNWMGTAFNGPNDLVLDAAGGIYFTDPDYENRRSTAEALYYRAPDGTLSRLKTFLATGTVRRPNGVALSPGGSVLYLAVEMNKRIFAYDVGPGGTISNERLFARTDVNAAGVTLPNITNGPDGLAIDAAGNVYCAVQNAVFVWSPAGVRLADIAVPQDPTNAKFGGADGRTLFITAGGNNAASLYGIELNVAAPALGDYDGDGSVTSADYTVWRDTLGATENLAADGNGNRLIDDGDLAVWQTRFAEAAGASATAGMTVPEPSVTILLAISLLMLGHNPRR